MKGAPVVMLSVEPSCVRADCLLRSLWVSIHLHLPLAADGRSERIDSDARTGHDAPDVGRHVCQVPPHPTLRVVHLGRSTCHAISGWGKESGRLSESYLSIFYGLGEMHPLRL